MNIVMNYLSPSLKDGDREYEEEEDDVRSLGDRDYQYGYGGSQVGASVLVKHFLANKSSAPCKKVYGGFSNTTMVFPAAAVRDAAAAKQRWTNTDVGMDFAAKNSGKLENNWL